METTKVKTNAEALTEVLNEQRDHLMRLVIDIDMHQANHDNNEELRAKDAELAKEPRFDKRGNERELTSFEKMDDLKAKARNKRIIIGVIENLLALGDKLPEKYSDEALKPSPEIVTGEKVEETPAAPQEAPAQPEVAPEAQPEAAPEEPKA